jgi:hypothetical protein
VSSEVTRYHREAEDDAEEEEEDKNSWEGGSEFWARPAASKQANKPSYPKLRHRKAPGVFTIRWNTSAKLPI